jgi:hypothetical protein
MMPEAERNPYSPGTYRHDKWNMDHGRASRPKGGGALGAVRDRASSAGMPAWAAGLVNGMLLGWGDELFGADSFEQGARSDPLTYYGLQNAGLLGSPLSIMVGRLPLHMRGKAFQEAVDVLGSAGVRQTAMKPPRPSVRGSLLWDPRQRAAIDRDIPDIGSPREHLRQPAIDAAQDLLMQRRASLDDLARSVALGHGVAIGAGGLEPGERDPLERVAGAGVGAGLGLTALGLSANVKDMSGYALRPLRGEAPARLSAQKVVDLPGKPKPTGVMKFLGARGEDPDVQGFYNQARTLEEEAFRARGGDPYLGRAAEPAGSGQNPYVAPIQDENSLIQAALRGAASSPYAQQRMGAMDDALAVQAAQERSAGLQGPGGAPMSGALPSFQERLPSIAIDDAAMRPDILKTVRGAGALPAPPPVAPPAAPSRTTLQQQAAAAKAANPGMSQRAIGKQVGTAQSNVSAGLRRAATAPPAPAARPPQPPAAPNPYPGMTSDQKTQLAQGFLQTFATRAQKLASLTGPAQVKEARKLLGALDDPRVADLFSDIGIREGNTSPEFQAAQAFRAALSQIVQKGAPTRDEALRSFVTNQYGAASGQAQDAATTLTQYPMSRRRR